MKKKRLLAFLMSFALMMPTISVSAKEYESPQTDEPVIKKTAENEPAQNEMVLQGENNELMLMAQTASGKCGDNLTWALTTEGVLVIYGTGDMYNWESKNPPSWYDYRASIKSVVIQSEVTNIGNQAFAGCSKLISVTISDSVTSIGDEAFLGCQNLTKITIPNSVAHLGAKAFLACYSLTSITLSDSLTSIGYGTFSNCTSLPVITIPTSVTRIEESAFYFCISLKQIAIPSSVTYIGPGAFCDTILTDIYYGNSESKWNAITIGKDNTPLLNATIHYRISGTCGDNLTWKLDLDDGELIILGTGKMKDWPSFLTPWSSYCAKITSIMIGSGVTSIGNLAFGNCTSLNEISIPKSVTSIGKSAFNNCTRLAEITIPKGVTSIEKNTFNSCESLTKINIPDSVTSIGEEAFYSCISLTEISIPDSVTSIGERAFESCENLTKVNIPDGMTSIENSTFSGCYSMSEITIPASVTSIGVSAFFSTSLTDVYYGGTETQWNAISIDMLNAPLTNATLHFMADEEEPAVPAELSFSFSDIEITAGEDAEFDEFSIQCNNDFTAGETLILTLNNGFYFAEKQRLMNGDTKISYKWLDDTELQITVPENPGKSFHLDGLTIIAEDDMETGDKVRITISGKGYVSCTATVGTVSGEAADKLELDVRPIEIYAGGEASFSRLGVDKTNRFNEGDKVTLTLSKGFSFIENDVFYDGDSTPIEVYSWSANQIVVLAPENPGSGFDLEELTISADENLAVDTKCQMTVSVDGYESVTKTVAYVVEKENIVDGECGDNIYWEFNLDTGVLTISGKGSMDNYSSSTAPWHEYASQITSIIVEEKVPSIGKYAFDGCSNVKTVTLPSTLTLIDQYAFNGVSSLTDVFYNGTKSQWEDISKKFGNTKLSGRIIHPIMAEGIGGTQKADLDADMSIQYFGSFDGTFSANNITTLKGTNVPKLVFDVNSFDDNAEEDGSVFSFTVNLENAKFITDEKTPITEEEAVSLFFITTSETNTTLAAATNEFVPVGYDGWKPMSGGSSDLDSHDLLLKVLISPDHTEIDYTVYAGADAPIGNGSKFGISLQSMLTETAPGTEATVTVISTFSSYETLPYCQVLSETYELQGLRIREAAGSMNYLTDIPQTSFVAEVGAKTGSVAGSLFLAGYDADGRMVFLNSQTASSENTTYLFYVENAESNIEELKVFFTSQDDSREPLTESIPFGKS